MLAISGTKGSSGFGSVSRDDILSNTIISTKIIPLFMVSAGDHWSFKISKHIAPF